VSKASKIRAMARKEFWAMAEMAKSEGKDLGEVLDRCGVLLTPERKLMIEHNVYTEVVALLEGSTLHEWTEPGTKIKSPEDAKVAITNRLRQIALAYERKAYGG